MNHWLLSDTHFNHLKLDEWGDRSGDWQEQLFLGIGRIPRGDTLIHLGDIAIGRDVDVHERLFAPDRGVAHGLRTVLVRGNHDGRSLGWYQEHGWGFVCDALELRYQGHRLHLTHRPAPRHGHVTFNIHGHTHGNEHRREEYKNFYSKDYHIDISPELRGFAPIRLDLLLKKAGPSAEVPSA